jgi:hypothetical protein
LTPSFFPYGFLVFFAGMWIGVSFFLSYISGWRTLAPRYPAAAEPAGERLLWNSAEVGDVSFRSCLNMTLSAAGLYMVPSLPFRLFMPPMLIPWSGVRFEGSRKFLFFESSCFRLGGDDGPVLSVRRSAGARFRPYLPEAARRDLDSGREFAGEPISRTAWILLAACAAAGLLAAIFAGKR